MRLFRRTSGNVVTLRSTGRSRRHGHRLGRCARVLGRWWLTLRVLCRSRRRGHRLGPCVPVLRRGARRKIGHIDWGRSNAGSKLRATMAVGGCCSDVPWLTSSSWIVQKRWNSCGKSVPGRRWSCTGCTAESNCTGIAERRGAWADRGSDLHVDSKTLIEVAEFSVDTVVGYLNRYLIGDCHRNAAVAAA